jgi:hypothetical protein
MKSPLLLASTAVGMVVLVAASGIVFARCENRTALNRAYALMDDADRFQMNRSTLDDALSFVKKHHGEARSSKPTGGCAPTDCMAEAEIIPLFYSRHTWLIPVVKQVGVHVFNCNVTVWIKDGKLVAVEKIFFVPKAVGADVYVATVVSDPDERISRNPSYKLHPAFITNYREGRGTPEFTYWSNASSAERTVPSTRMNLDCVATLAGCKSVAQILPAAWGQHQADASRIESLEK